ncbi:Ig domain-containing protein [Peribacillus sp. Hz7]|uniref:Ig-like domain-containing protein n=1 Tax=Peribacillus sp. Hz7 TaxID=3344873 RepID=UPI0035CB2F16
MKKIMSAILVCCLIFTQGIAYAINVEIPDPTPDLQAPIINEISVSSNELSPTTPIKVIADISDELSGFNQGTITYTKPTNQTLTVPFVLNSTTGKYEASITVPEIDVEGEWKVSRIYLQDKKENYVYLSHLATQSNGEKIDFSTLNLNVTGVTDPPVSTDKEAPVLHSISVGSQQLSVNEKIEVIAEVTDNESGVSTVRANYKKPSGASQSIYLYKNAAGQFVGSHTIGKYEESGEWVLSSIYMSDKDGNSQTITNYIDGESNQKNLDHCKVTVGGTTIDSEAPILQEISVISQQIKANEKIEVRAEVTDNESGVSSVRVTYKKPSGQLQSFYLSKNAEGQFVGSVTIGQYEERGNRILTAVYLRDAVGNSKEITSYLDTNNNVKDFTHCTVEVTGTTPDWEGPEFTSGKISVQQISSTQAAVKLIIEVEDSLSGITNSSLTGIYRKPMSGKLLNVNFLKQNNQYTATILFDKYDEIGEWALENLVIRDAVGNYNTLKKIGNHSFSEFNINVMGKITVTPGTYNSISFEAPESLNEGQTYQLKPMLRSSNADVMDIDITNDSITKYSTTNSKLLTVNSTGLVTVPDEAGSGFVILEVSYGEIQKQVQIKVNNGSIESFLQVSPLSTTLHPGQTEQMKVVEINDDVRKDITGSSSGVTYTSSNPALVTVTEDGLIQVASGDIQGSADIHVVYNGLVAKTMVKVSKPVVKSLVISPREETLSAINNKLQLVLKAFMTDGTTKDVTASSKGTKYTSSSSARATVDGEGKVTIVPNAPAGNVTITATNGNFKATSIITVEEDPSTVVKNIKVTPGTATLKAGDTQQLTVRLVMGDGSEKDVTASSEGTKYTSSTTARATVDGEGKVTIVPNAPAGNVTITATNGNFKATSIITVEEDPSTVVKSIKVTPGTATLKAGDTQQLTVKLVMGDGSEKDVTASSKGTKYTSSTTARATVDGEGKVTIVPNAPAGNVTITATNGNFKATSIITVEEDPSTVVKNIKVTPGTATLKAGDTQQLTVRLVMGDGSEKDVTASSKGTKYTSSTTARATVDGEGKVTIVPNAPAGNVTITVKNGTISEKIIITVIK